MVVLIREDHRNSTQIKRSEEGAVHQDLVDLAVVHNGTITLVVLEFPDKDSMVEEGFCKMAWTLVVVVVEPVEMVKMVVVVVVPVDQAVNGSVII
jgi:hypothetical protein